ncbi:MAG: glycosyltransferase [Oscillospiraceae bacterium]|nr:glycosyltransferase [Oscillospiraceae bacterium]
MILTYISRFQFKIQNGEVFALPAYGDGFWTKYLEVFESIIVVGEHVKSYLDDGNMVKLTDKRIKVEIIPSAEHPREFIQYPKMRRALNTIIRNSDAALIKPSSNKGICAIKTCKKYNIPYMIEMTGDVRLALECRRKFFVSCYANILYRRIIKNIADCQFGLYVTEHYLQKQYPISGEMCGCTDTLLPPTNTDVIKDRIARIQAYNNDTPLNIGLIGYYKDNSKGVDTAIDALALLQKKYKNRFNLNILGVGKAPDRQRWIKYAEQRGVSPLLNFSHPLGGSGEVVKWIDLMDLIILPSRSEGFPRAIAETMSRGCPAITSNVCGLSELVAPQWQHKAGDAQELTNLIDEMFSDKLKLINAADYNYNKARNYDSRLLAKRRNDFLFRFYQKAASVKP